MLNFLNVIPPQTIALVSAVFTVAALLFSIYKLRQESAFSRIPPLLGIVITAVITALYILLSGVQVNYLVGGGLVLVGLFLGLLQGRASQVYVREERIRVKRGTGSLVLWGVTYFVSLALSLTTNPLLAAGGVLALLFGLGAAVGTNLNLLLRSTTNASSLVASDAPPVRPTSLPR